MHKAIIYIKTLLPHLRHELYTHISATMRFGTNFIRTQRKGCYNYLQKTELRRLVNTISSTKI